MERFIIQALKEAQKAKDIDEVPIGCVIVDETTNKIIAKAHNQRIKQKDATAHAELLAIRKACKKFGDWRLENCTLYVTLEPCVMCAGAILNSRIKRVVFGAKDEKSGFLGGNYDISNKSLLNHNFEVIGGILEDQCKLILQDFFKSKRHAKPMKVVK